MLHYSRAVFPFMRQSQKHSASFLNRKYKEHYIIFSTCIGNLMFVFILIYSKIIHTTVIHQYCIKRLVKALLILKIWSKSLGVICNTHKNFRLGGCDLSLVRDILMVCPGTLVVPAYVLPGL